MDSLTLHYVARELDTRWREHSITACRLDRESETLTIWCEGSAAIVFDLRALEIRAATADPHGELLRGWTIAAVTAPTDERRLIIQCERAGKFRGSPSRHGDITISFVPNARVVRVRDSRHSLGSLGGALRPVAEPRPQLDVATIRAAVANRDDATMLRGRWMSPRVCEALISQPDRAVEIYRMIVALPPPAPVRCGAVLYPLPLCAPGEPVSSLILPASDRTDLSQAPRSDRVPRAVARMQRELERAREAPRLRAIADALTALGVDGTIPESIVLPDGTSTPVPPPARDDSAVSLAARLYKQARAMERAMERLPARMAALATHTPSPTTEPRPTARRATAAGESRRLPYKSYRSSGGIDILVGRGAGSNDELTFEIAKPDDVWLHARDVTGAHVVLRWSEKGAPPTRDLHQAAALAAWHSRARGSVVVPVDWTRRRHVRRARGSPPGRVLVDRAKTVMARPTAELERRLRLRIGD